MPLTLGKYKSILMDNLPVSRPGFYLIASPEYFCFFSVSPKRWVTIHAQVDLTGPDEKVLESFLQKLKSEGAYFGQEITVLLSEPTAYTIIKSADESDLDKFREECLTLATDENGYQEFRSISIWGKSYYVVFGIDASFLEKTAFVLEKQGFFIQTFMALSGLIISQAENAPAEKDFRSIIVSIGKCQCFLGFDQKNRLIYAESIDKPGCDNTAGENWWQLIAAISASNDNSNCNYYSKTRPNFNAGGCRWTGLERFFKRLPFGSKGNELSLKEKIPSYARTILVAMGSARLLISISIILLCTFLITGAILSALRHNSQELYDQYQSKLEKIMIIESRLIKLDKKLSSLDDGYMTPTNFGAYLSLFCQKVPRDVCLTDLRAEMTLDGKTDMFAKGLSRKETSIFKYCDYLNQIEQDVSFELKSLARIIQYPGTQDSVSYRFVIGKL